MKPIATAALLLLLSTSAFGADDNKISLTLSNHRFTPTEIHVKANTPTTVTLTNEDDQAEEFDSTTLRIEKIVAGHATGTSAGGRSRPGTIRSWANSMPRPRKASSSRSKSGRVLNIVRPPPLH